VFKVIECGMKKKLLYIGLVATVGSTKLILVFIVGLIKLFLYWFEEQVWGCCFSRFGGF
jgi:hypothetical protein